MNPLEKYESLNCCLTIEEWRSRIVKFACELGYELSILAIFPDHNTPIEFQLAFLQHNISLQWINKYDEEKLGKIDPLVSHCRTKKAPLIWSPDTFSSNEQKKLYEAACEHGLQAGVTLPINGLNGEFGLLCFAADIKPETKVLRDMARSVPKLTCLRDFIIDSSLRFINPPDPCEQVILLTSKELECIKWYAAGKSTWAIAKLMLCTESAVNHHFANIRRKFSASTRNQAVVRAISMNIITPP